MSAQSKAIALVIGLALFGAVGASAATFNAAAKPALCSLGQKSAKAKPCTANPAFGVTACATLVPLLQPLAPGDSIVGSNKNTGAPATISCWFLANGQRQSFDVQVYKGADAAKWYAQGLQQYTGYAADPTVSCGSGAAQAALQTVSGLGDKAFAWASCPPPETGYTLAAAVQGSTYVYAYANPYRVGATLDQVESVVRQLLTKYR